MKALDLIGWKLGRLKVVARAASRKTSKRSTSTYWVVVCECGRRAEARGTHLINGIVVSCGCYRASIFKRGTPRNTKGQRRRLTPKTPV